MTIQGIVNKDHIQNNRKLERKVNLGKVFEVNIQEDKEHILSANVNLLNNINPFLVLNEISQEEEEKKLLKEKGKKLIDILKEIRLILLEGRFTEEKLLELKISLNSSILYYHTDSIREIAEEIKLRVEVELAKIELMK